MNTGINALRPVVTHPVVDRAGLITRPWADYLARLASIQSSDDMRQLLEALAKRVAELEDGGGVSVVGRKSVRSTGSSIIYIQLAGDEDAPGSTEYYGTGPDGAKGFFPVADAIAVRTDELDKLVGVDGVITLGLADLPDTGGGELKKIVRDDKGRVSGTSEATTDDLPEGVANLYFTDERAAAAAPVQSVNGKTGDVVLDASDVGADASGAAAAAVAAHVAESDPHPQYTTASEAAAAAPVQSVNTKTGAVVLGASDVGAIAVTGTTNLSSSVNIYGQLSNESIITISGGGSGSSTTGANMQFAGTSHPTAPGRMRISSGTGADIEIGLPTGQALRPTTDNSRSLGSAANRWSVVYAGTGTINTSDAREKTAVRPLTAAEIATAIDLANEIGAYQWLAMIEAKGEAGARLHIGLTVQRAIEIMEAHGLDPFRYGFICFDEWDDLPEVVGEDGEIAQEHRPAGSRYSFRMDELLDFIARGFAHRLTSIEQRLAAAGL